jgi:hypothetical protein
MSVTPNKQDLRQIKRFQKYYSVTMSELPEKADQFVDYTKRDISLPTYVYRISNTDFYKYMKSLAKSIENSGSSSSSNMMKTLSPAVLKAAMDRGISPNALTQAQINEAEEKERQKSMIQAGLLTFGLTSAAILLLRK